MEKEDFVHFIGIGGVSMSGIAIELARQGFNVSGSDASLCENNIYLQEIQNFGQIRVFDGGHDASNLDPNVKFIIATSTISDDNPELKKAISLGMKVLQRFEAINMLTQEYKNRIGIFGGAGKTTTTALMFFLFQNAGLLPSVFLGSVMKNLMSSVHINYAKNFCIVETDESDASFGLMNMNAGVFVAMENDHLEHNAYSGSYDNMKTCFSDLLQKLQNQNSPICYNEDSLEVKNIISSTLPHYSNIKSFSINNQNATFYGTNFKFIYGGMSFDLYHKGQLFLENIFMPLIGDFNALNVIAGIAMLSFFVSSQTLQSAILRLRTFEGIDKRQSKVGRFHNFDIIDDYAHSPLKIKSMLHGFNNYTNAISADFITICEIHKMSRFKNMYNEFLLSFQNAKILVLIDIFKVSGYNEEDSNMELFVKDIKKHNSNIEVIYSSNQILPQTLYKIIQRKQFANNANNFLLFLGAGKSSNIAKNMQQKLQEIEDSLR